MVSEWNLVKLTDKAVINMGQSPKSEDCNEDGEGLPFYQGVTDFGTIYPIPTRFCTEPKKIAEENDILISVRAPVGEVNISNCKVAIGRGVSSIRPVSINNIFLFYYMKYYKQNWSRFQQGSTFTAINKTDLNNIEVPDISRREQQKIAAILFSVDEAIEKTEQIIEQTETVKKGLMQQLLTKGIRHTEFKITTIGEIPKQWTVNSLTEVTLNKEGMRRGPFGGALKKNIFVEDGHAVYEQQHVIKYNLSDFRYFITDEKFEEMRNFEVKPGDLLISCSGTVGRVVLVPLNSKSGIINQALLRLRLNANFLNNNYAYYLLSSNFMHNKMTEMSHGSTLKNIVGMKELKQILIPVPPIEEQNRIVEILDNISAKEQAEKQKFELLTTLKQGLMQQLLTGKVRVPIDDKEEVPS